MSCRRSTEKFSFLHSRPSHVAFLAVGIISYVFIFRNFSSHKVWKGITRRCLRSRLRISILWKAEKKETKLQFEFSLRFAQEAEKVEGLGVCLLVSSIDKMFIYPNLEVYLIFCCPITKTCFNFTFLRSLYQNSLVFKYFISCNSSFSRFKTVFRFATRRHAYSKNFIRNIIFNLIWRPNV